MVLMLWVEAILLWRDERHHETARNRREEAAESFWERKSLAGLLIFMREWVHVIKRIRAGTTRLTLRHCSRTLRTTFAALVALSSLRRLDAVGSLVGRLQISWALRSWNLQSIGVAVSQLCCEGRLRWVLGLWRKATTHSQAIARLSSVLERHFDAWLFERLLAHAARLAALEAALRVATLQKRCSSAVATWRAKCLHSLRVEVLPQILAAWRQVCQARRLQRRCELIHGLRQWRVHARGRWAFRRRLVIADMLAARRLLRAAWLPWQLCCFSEPGSSEVLMDRWCDTMATSDIVRPLVTLCGPSQAAAAAAAAGFAATMTA